MGLSDYLKTATVIFRRRMLGSIYSCGLMAIVAEQELGPDDVIGSRMSPFYGSSLKTIYETNKTVGE